MSIAGNHTASGRVRSSRRTEQRAQLVETVHHLIPDLVRSDDPYLAAFRHVSSAEIGPSKVDTGSGPIAGLPIRTGPLAERVGISRDMLYRIEKGDPRCEIGVVFEMAVILGVPLFEPEAIALDRHVREAQDRLALLPKAVHAPRGEVKDDF